MSKASIFKRCYFTGTELNHFYIFIPVVGTVYVCELLMFKSEPTITNVKMDIHLLREEIQFLKENHLVSMY
jgi:hypothetical protein